MKPHPNPPQPTTQQAISLRGIMDIWSDLADTSRTSRRTLRAFILCKAQSASLSALSVAVFHQVRLSLSPLISCPILLFLSPLSSRYPPLSFTSTISPYSPLPNLSLLTLSSALPNLFLRSLSSSLPHFFSPYPPLSPNAQRVSILSWRNTANIRRLLLSKVFKGWTVSVRNQKLRYQRGHQVLSR
jgi:hypothetical protein